MLQNLKDLCVRANKLETIPHNIITSPKLTALDLYDNPLTIETLLYLQHHTPETVDLIVDRSSYLMLTQFSNTLKKLYSLEEATEKEQQISALASEEYRYKNHIENQEHPIYIGEDLTGTVVLIDFLSRGNLFKSADPNDWIKFITKKILHTILSNETENEEKANAIAKLNVALGNCNTPILNYLMTELLAEYQGKSEKHLPEYIANYAFREALGLYVAEHLAFRI